MSPSAPITQARRELLDLYLYAIDSPEFLETRHLNKPALVEFDRRAYVDGLSIAFKEWLKRRPEDLVEPLQTVTPRIPENFESYILEWPEKAIMEGFWPEMSEDSQYFSQNLLYFPEFSIVEFFLYQPDRNKNQSVYLPALVINILGMGGSLCMTLADWNHGQPTFPEVRAGHICVSDGYGDGVEQSSSAYYWTDRLKFG